jgi:2-haloacid dehalogenase
MAGEQHEYALLSLRLDYARSNNKPDKYEPFSSITQKSLQHALKEHGLSLAENDIAEMMGAYDSLSTFPDVKPALDALAKEQGITSVVFSQGTYAMVSASVNKSPDLSPHASVFKDIVVVEEVHKFKPAPEVYHHLARKLGKSREEYGSVWLVSGNPFDIVGARAMGMNAAWCDRQGNGWVDCLGEPGLRPTVIVKGLGEVVEKVRAHKG